MLSCRDACRRAVQRNLGANAFGRNSKRYGSSIPGPLEAQRRLSRRRMMNLTAACGGTVSGLGPLVGSEGWLERRDWEWQSPPDVKSADPPTLPLWLMDTVPQPVATPTAVDEKTPDGEEAVAPSEPIQSEVLQHGSQSQLPDNPSLLMQALSLATDVDHVRRVIEDSAKSPRVGSGPEYGEVIIQRLLDLHAPMDVLVDFLANPAVSFSGARVIQKIFHYFRQRQVTELEYISMTSALKRVVALGLASEEEIREVIVHVPSLAARVYANTGARDIAVISFYSLIWEGIQSCTVLPVHGLAAETLDLLLCQLRPIRFSIGMQALGVSIITSASTSQLRRMRRGVSLFLANWVRGCGGSVGSEVGQLGAIPEMAGLLDDMPNGLARYFVSSTTTTLLVQKIITIEPGSSYRPLYRWVDTIGQCRSIVKSGVEWRAIEDVIAADRSQRRVARYLMGFGSRETCEFFLRYWVRYEIEERGGGGYRTDAILYNLQRRFRGMCKGPDDRRAYFKVILALHQFGQPYGTIATELFRLLRHLSRYNAMVDVARGMKHHRLPLGSEKMSHTIRDVAKVSPASALQLLALFPSVKPEDHEDLLCLSITDKLLYADDIFTLIRDNTRWRKDHKANVDLLHNLALTFAHTSYLSPRAALRHVHRCWLALRRFGLPLTPKISRAFVHAGITRSLQGGQWVSSLKLKWILKLVSELEGKEVADGLDETVFSWRGRIVGGRSKGLRG